MRMVIPFWALPRAGFIRTAAQPAATTRSVLFATPPGVRGAARGEHWQGSAGCAPNGREGELAWESTPSGRTMQAATREAFDRPLAAVDRAAQGGLTTDAW